MKEIDLHFVLDRVLRGWRTSAAFAIAAVVFVLVSLPFQRPAYRVKMTVIPAPVEQGAAGSNVGGSTLTTLLGINQNQSSNYTRYEKLLTSTAVAQRMQDKRGMLQYVFSSYWDAQDKKWVPPQTMRGFLLGWLFKLSHVPLWTPPDVSKLSDYLASNLLVVPSTDSDIITVSMDGPDVAFSRRVMLAAHEEANAVLREQSASRARQQVAYLQMKLAETQVADYRATLLAILSSQEKTLMLTQTSASYAADLLSAPVASATPIRPRPVLSVVVAILVGLLLGCATVVLFGPDWMRMAVEKISGAIATMRKPAIARGRDVQ